MQFATQAYDIILHIGETIAAQYWNCNAIVLIIVHVAVAVYVNNFHAVIQFASNLLCVIVPDYCEESILLHLSL